MSIITESLWTDLLLAILLSLFLIYWFITYNDRYWDERGIPNKKEGLVYKQVVGRQSQAETVKEWYKLYSGEKYFGFVQFRKPILMINDLDLIHQVLVKDFHHFQDRGQPQNKKDFMTNNLFGMRGQMWREMRYKLTPTFTTGKLKGMFEQVAQCGVNMIRKIELLSHNNTDIESKDFLFEFTSDVIASCAFGVQFEPNTPEFYMFKKMVKRIFNPSIFSLVKIVIAFTLPKLAEFFTIRPFMAKENADYFMTLIKEATKHRKENNIKRNDYLQLLLTLKDQEEQGVLSHLGLSSSDTSEDDAVILDQMKYSGSDQDQPFKSDTKLFTEETVCANSAIFLVAGSESTSSTISMTLFHLTANPEIQKRLQNEVDTVLSNHGGKWSYQAIKDMTYLDQVVQESQRIHPIIPLLQRECTKPYKIPNSDLFIEKGGMIAIPVAGLHMDPQFYPDPEIFRPERFEGNNFKPSATYLPFGDGPRICIAMRFAVMEVKTCLAKIMAEYSVKLSQKTQVPLQIDPRSFVPTVKGGLWLQFEKRLK